MLELDQAKRRRAVLNALGSVRGDLPNYTPSPEMEAIMDDYIAGKIDVVAAKLRVIALAKH